MRLTKDYIIGDRVKVEFVDLGEGYHGDYNPDDPDDKPLLRFDVYTRKSHKKWEALEDGSYCTGIPVDTSEDERKWVLLYLCYEVEQALDTGRSLKKLCEQLSWVLPTDVTITKFKIGNLLMKLAEEQKR